MSAGTLTSRLSAAAEDRTSGATGVARQVIDGLLELVDDPDRLRAAADLMAGRLPWYAPMWHIVRAAHDSDPAPGLRRLRERLYFDVDRSVAAAVKLVEERGGPIRTAPSSALVKAVVAAVPNRTGSGAVTGLAGADAIGPSAVLNIIGTYDLACTVPTIVVTTSLKLVPEGQFQRTGAPSFERIPLYLFEAVVLDGEVLSPSEAGARAAALDG
jgi:hypothetical protein